MSDVSWQGSAPRNLESENRLPVLTARVIRETPFFSIALGQSNPIQSLCDPDEKSVEHFIKALEREGGGENATTLHFLSRRLVRETDHK